MANDKKVVRKRRERKNIEKGAAHICSTFNNTIVTITDTQGNVDVVAIENDGSYVDTSYTFRINIADLKLVLDSCKNEHITVNCGNHKSIIICRANISNVIAETRTKE
jgi:hypothetical protein